MKSELKIDWSTSYCLVYRRSERYCYISFVTALKSYSEPTTAKQAHQLGANHVLERVVAYMQYAIGVDHSGGRIGISWLRVWLITFTIRSRNSIAWLVKLSIIATLSPLLTCWMILLWASLFVRENLS